MIKLIGRVLDHGAKVNAEDDKGYTPLMNAVCNQGVDVVELLLHNGAERQIDSCDHRERTPLFCAAGKGRGGGSLSIVTSFLALERRPKSKMPLEDHRSP